MRTILHALLVLAIAATGSTTVAALQLAEAPTEAPAGADAPDEAGAFVPLARFQGLPDPETWIGDAETGFLYRRATANEIAVNGWAPGAFLVHTGIPGGLVAGAPSLSLLLPTGDGVAERLDFVLQGIESSGSFALFPLDAQPRILQPTFFTYLAPLSGAKATLTLSDVGGSYGKALAGDLQAEIFGPEPSRHLDAVPTSDGAPIDAGSVLWIQFSVPTEEAPALVNFAQAVVDDPFGLFGEIKWCTSNSANWPVLMQQTGDEITIGFTGTAAKLLPQFYACWLAANMADANFCANTGGCLDANGHAYTFNACGTNPNCYRDRAWADVAHARLHFVFPALKIAQVQHLGIMSGGICGLSRFPPGGDSVTIGLAYAGTGCKEFVSTHEVGHSFNAVHELAIQLGTCWTVMRPSGLSNCRHDVFSPQNTQRINDCVLLSGATCPRIGTG